MSHAEVRTLSLKVKADAGIQSPRTSPVPSERATAPTMCACTVTVRGASSFCTATGALRRVLAPEVAST